MNQRIAAQTLLGTVGAIVFAVGCASLEDADWESVGQVAQALDGDVNVPGVGLGFSAQKKANNLQSCASGLGCTGFSPTRGIAPKKRTRGTNSQMLLDRNLQLADINGDRKADYVQYRTNKLFIESAETDKREIGHAYFIENISRVIVGDFYGAGWDQVCAYAGGVLHCYGIDPEQDDQLRLWFRQKRTIDSDQDLIVGDFDKNGRDEILLYNHVNGEFDLWGVTGNQYFGYRTDWDISNLPKAGTSNVKWRAGDWDGDGDDDLIAINRSNQLLRFTTVKNGGLIKFWWGFTTVPNFISDQENVQLANVNGDDSADLVVHNESTGAIRFHRLMYDNGSPNELSTPIGQIKIRDNSQLVMSYSHVARNEPGSEERDDAFVYDRDNRWIYKSEARHDGNEYTYWYQFSRFAPNNHYNWSGRDRLNVAFVKCQLSDNNSQPNNNAFYTSLHERIIDYFGEMTYGAIDLSASTLDQTWYPMAITGAQAKAQTRSQVANACEAAAGTNSANADAVIMFNNFNYDAGTTGNRSLLKPAWHDVKTGVHEIIHAISSLGDITYDDDNNKYGNPWAIMSSAAPTFSFQNPLQVAEGPGMIAYNLDIVTPLPSQRVKVITNNSSKKTVYLSALNRPATPHYLWLKAETAGSNYYSVEYRERFGLDRGVRFHAVVIHEIKNGKSYLQTKNPDGTRLDWSSSERREGEEFTTPEGIKFKVLKIDPVNHQARVEVSYNN